MPHQKKQPHLPIHNPPKQPLLRPHLHFPSSHSQALTLSPITRHPSRRPRPQPNPFSAPSASQPRHPKPSSHPHRPSAAPPIYPSPLATIAPSPTGADQVDLVHAWRCGVPIARASLGARCKDRAVQLRGGVSAPYTARRAWAAWAVVLDTAF